MSQKCYELMTWHIRWLYSMVLMLQTYVLQRKWNHAEWFRANSENPELTLARGVSTKTWLLYQSSLQRYWWRSLVNVDFLSCDIVTKPMHQVVENSLKRFYISKFMFPFSFRSRMQPYNGFLRASQKPRFLLVYRYCSVREDCGYFKSFLFRSERLRCCCRDTDEGLGRGKCRRTWS